MEWQQVHTLEHTLHKLHCIYACIHIEGTDFVALEPLQVMFVSGDDRDEDLDIAIISDGIVEEREEFNVSMVGVNLINSLDGNTPNLTDEERARLNLSPRVANVFIRDDDGMYN